MINLKAEVKKRASRMHHGAVGRGRSHNGEYRSEGATAIFVGRGVSRGEVSAGNTIEGGLMEIKTPYRIPYVS